MFANVIDNDVLMSYFSNPTDFVLEGNIHYTNYSEYYRFVRILLESGEHYVEALYGQSYGRFPISLTGNKFSTRNKLDFMAYIVDHKDFYNETYDFLICLGKEKLSPHFVTKDMIQTLWNYLEENVKFESKDVDDFAGEDIVYQTAVLQYVFEKEKDSAFYEVADYVKEFDDTVTVEFLANPTTWAKTVAGMLDDLDRAQNNVPFSEYKGKNFVIKQHLIRQKIHEFESLSMSWEKECKNIFSTVSHCKNVRIAIEVNGKELMVNYPVKDIKKFTTVAHKKISTFPIVTRDIRNNVEQFLKENYSDYNNDRYEIPMKLISRIESGRKILWSNPFFECS